MRAKKSLGQHFLKSRKVIADMVSAANVKESDSVLEIGPGKGVLTEALLSTGAKVFAVEKDEALAETLKEKFEEEIKSGALKLVEGDILTAAPAYWSGGGAYKIVANIPYYITGEFLKKFLSAKNQPESMTLLVQKEVAERIARSKKESILSLSVKAYGTPRYVQTVRAREFSPPPKIDSAILHIGNISKDFFADMNEEKFFELVKAGFIHKRKLLARNLESITRMENITQAFVACSISEKARAEDLALASWRCVTYSLY